MTRVATLCALLATASVAAAQESPPVDRGVFGEPAAITRAIDWADGRFGISTEGEAPRRGWFVTSGKTVAGAGWIAGGGGYRHYVLGHRAFFDVSAGTSIRAYKTMQATFEWPRLNGRALAVGSQAFWQDLTQVAYFGTGPDTLDTGRAQYRVHYLDVIGYATAQASDVVSVTFTGGLLRQPHISTATGPLRRDLPDVRELFPDEPALRSDASARFRHAGISVIADSRDHPGYPSRGGLYRAAWRSFWGPTAGILSFHRLETEGLQFLPLAGDRLVVALHAHGLFTDTSEGRYVPFFMMGTAGGHSLRGYEAYRFSDKNVLVASVEPRIRLTTHLDAAVFLDAGTVAAFARELDLAKRSWGFGVRLHTRTSTLARFDVARGTEGWRLIFNLSDPFRLSRVTRKTAPLPFNP